MPQQATPASMLWPGDQVVGVPSPHYNAAASLHALVGYHDGGYSELYFIFLNCLQPDRMAERLDDACINVMQGHPGVRFTLMFCF